MMDIKLLKDMTLEMKARYGEQWSSALCKSGTGVDDKMYHAVISEENDDLFIKTDDDSLENSWLCDYLEAVSPGCVLELIKRLDAAEAQLARYSMSAGEADQRASESRAVRNALGFCEEADDVAPCDLVDAINALRAEGVERYIESVLNANMKVAEGGGYAGAVKVFRHLSEVSQYFANQLREGK